MGILKLVLPTLAYLDQIAGYRREFLEMGGSMDGAGPLRKMADPADWLESVERHAHRETVPEGRVQSTQFLAVREADDRLVGMIQVRHYFNAYLEKYAGHIGYSVRPSERRKGYAKEMLRQCLPYCREIGLMRVMIACNDNNEASRRTILANGGVYEKTVYEPDEKVNLEQYWITL